MASLVADRTLVYHETQVGSLCGRHALNNLLQGAYFTEVDLANIAEDLDAAEMHLMDRGRMMGPSANVDDAGNFSITVLREALARSFRLTLESGREADTAVANPDAAVSGGFILNLAEHWFAIRRLLTADGPRWFLLNSVSSAPELISNFYLGAYLAQMRADGYVVFLVVGTLPTPRPDTSTPYGKYHTVASIAAAAIASGGPGNRRAAAARARQQADEDPDFARALRASLAAVDSRSITIHDDDDADDANLRAAVAASLQRLPAAATTTASAVRTQPPRVAEIFLPDAAAGATAEIQSPAVDILQLATMLADRRRRLPAEPPAGTPGCARIQLRIPVGVEPLVAAATGRSSATLSHANTIAPAVQRRFNAADTLVDLLVWAELSWIESRLPQDIRAAVANAPPSTVSGVATMVIRPFSLMCMHPQRMFSHGDAASIRDASGTVITISSAGLAPSASLTLRC